MRLKAAGPDYRASDVNLADHALPAEKLKPEPLACLERTVEGFVRWRLRYTGRITTPWQYAAAEEVITAYFSPDREYMVINVFPGSGKTTLLSDIGAWLTCIDRTIRGLMGARTSTLAVRNTNRVRRLLDRPTPIKASEEEKDRGIAIDAVAVPAVDYGRFKPLQGGDIWRRDEFMVVQADGAPSDEKEPTWSAFGFDQGYLGNRFNVSFWDDIDDTRSIRNIEIVERNRQIFDDETEPRLEPGGLLVVCQQRLGLYDFSNYCLSKTVMQEEGDEEEPRPKYRHIVYKAHYEDRCTGDHAQVPAWPEGCILDEHRLPWRELRAHMTKPNFACVYQQEDVDPTDVLVRPVWVTGGRDEKGTQWPGCWDTDRELCELPRTPDGAIALSGDLFSCVTADPSPTRFWAIGWWVYHADTEQRFLMDLVRQKMDAPDLLDWNYNEHRFTGLMEEWQERSQVLGIPITDWVVEENAAQRFLLQYEHVRRWQMHRSVNITGHQTHRNKSDNERGVWSLQPHWMYGRVRLPGKGDGRIASLKLVDEVTRYPQAQTDDCVLMQWIFEWNLPNLWIPPEAVNPPPEPVPTWLRGESDVAYASVL